MKRIVEKLNKINDYNFNYNCSYLNVSETSNDIYQRDFLKSFNIHNGIFELNHINNTVSQLFDAIKDDMKIVELLNIIKDKYHVSDMEMAFMMCFSYDFFERTHQILGEYIKGNKPNELIDEMISQCKE